MDDKNVKKNTTENSKMIESNVDTTSISGKNGAIHNGQENGYNHSNVLITNGVGGGGGDTNHSSSTSSSQSSGTQTPTLDTKLIFFEMMAQIIRYQLQICDRRQPNKSTESADQTMASSLDELSLTIFPRLDDSKKRPYMLQPSMFPLMYPTVYFVSEDDVRKYSLMI